MYGSLKKDDLEPWTVKYIMELTKDDILYTEIDDAFNAKYVRLFSIRNKTVESKYTELAKTLIKNMTNSESQVFRRRTRAVAVNQFADLDYVNTLVDLLSPSRADDYNTWIRVGWCLFNIHTSLLPTWIRFSSTSHEFEEGVCEDMWDEFKSHNLGMGTLIMWAREDNPNGLESLLTYRVNRQVVVVNPKCELDIARIIHMVLASRVVCVNDGIWFVCQEGTNVWRLHKNDDYINMQISTQIEKLFKKASRDFSHRALESTDNDAQEKYHDMAKRMIDVSNSLRTTNYKRRVISECHFLFRDIKFEEKLDSNPYVIAFTNGLLDLETKQLRPICPEDYISRVTGTEYIPWDILRNDISEREGIKWVEEQFTKIYSSPD